MNSDSKISAVLNLIHIFRFSIMGKSILELYCFCILEIEIELVGDIV
ncbi:MAG: hypothetical protein LBD84_00775 [Campylobacteraceae bacterium]|jgi:hypothetical protein|nr:hypothetical protein [Campylobacteraceae bacterium]